jgi:hypothetical protein
LGLVPKESPCITKNKISLWFKLLEYVLHYFVHNDALTT